MNVHISLTLSRNNAIIQNIKTQKDKKMNVKELRKDVFQTVYGVSTFSQVLELFEQDYNRYKNRGINKILELYKNYSYAIFFMYSPSSIRNNLVKFKNIIKKNGGKYQANALEAFDIENIYSPIKRGDEERKERITEKVLSGEVSDDVTEKELIAQIELIKQSLETRSYKVAKNQKEEQVRAYRILFMLALATGRRFTELLKTIEIVKHGKKTLFKGLLKGNNETIEAHIIGLNYKEAKEYLKELREYVKTDNMTEAQINAKYAKVFNNALKRFAQQGLIMDSVLAYFLSVQRKVKGVLMNGEPNVKGCRDLYAKVGSAIFFDPKQDRDRTQTASRILGHHYVIQSSEGYINK